MVIKGNHNIIKPKESVYTPTSSATINLKNINTQKDALTVNNSEDWIWQQNGYKGWSFLFPSNDVKSLVAGKIEKNSVTLGNDVGEEMITFTLWDNRTPNIPLTNMRFIGEGGANFDRYLYQNKKYAHGVLYCELGKKTDKFQISDHILECLATYENNLIVRGTLYTSDAKFEQDKSFFLHLITSGKVI